LNDDGAALSYDGAMMNDESEAIKNEAEPRRRRFASVSCLLIRP
jgi:hypothetical protein